MEDCSDHEEEGEDDVADEEDLVGHLSEERLVAEDDEQGERDGGEHALNHVTRVDRILGPERERDGSTKDVRPGEDQVGTGRASVEEVELINTESDVGVASTLSRQGRRLTDKYLLVADASQDCARGKKDEPVSVCERGRRTG